MSGKALNLQLIGGGNLSSLDPCCLSVSLGDGVLPCIKYVLIVNKLKIREVTVKRNVFFLIKYCIFSMFNVES